MIRNYIALIFFLTALTGCATNQTGMAFFEAPSVPDNMGTLYVMRTIVPFMTPQLTVKINDIPFVTLRGKGYSYIYLTPGIYRLTFVMATSTVFMSEIEIQQGRDLFELTNDFSLSEIPTEKALYLFRDYKYVTPLDPKLKVMPMNGG